MAIRKLVQMAVITAFAANGIACGDITLPMTLGLEGENNFIDMYIPAGAANPVTMDLEGGVETTMTVHISLLDLLFGQPIVALIQIDDLLFAATPFVILGIPTEEVCVVVDETVGGGGIALIDLGAGTMQVNMDLATAVLLGSPTLSQAIPNGFPFVISVSETGPFSLADMLGLLGGGGGGFSVSQSLDEVMNVQVLGLTIPIRIVAELTLATVDAFPSGPYLDDCIAFLAE